MNLNIAAVTLVIASGTSQLLAQSGGQGLDDGRGRPAGSAVVPAAGEPSHFKGSIALPGFSLGFSIRLTRGLDGSPEGTIDIPMQSVDDYPLSDVEWTDQRLAFVMRVPGAPESAWPKFSFDLGGSGDEGAFKGLLRQSGAEFQATLEAVDQEPEGARRPQEPKAPFPYTAREVTFENPSGGLTIAGTLTLPEGAGPFPCVVLITGSGAQDRDETLMGHKPFLVIADHLTRRGIAVLRCDDRGVGGTGAGDQADPDSMDFVTDIRSALDFLETVGEVDAKRLGLIGHSEGALIGPIVASQDARVSFLVMLAGPGVPGDEILVRQSEAMALASGADPERVEGERATRVAFFDAVKRGDAEAARPLLEEMVRAAMEGVDDGMIAQTVEAQMGMMRSRWMRTFLAYDPRPTLAKVRCPVLVLNGDLDLQVLHDQNVPEVVRALKEGGNQGVTVHVLPGLNHLFQPATTGGMSEYATIETTFDPGALELMSSWIMERAGLGR